MAVLFVAVVVVVVEESIPAGRTGRPTDEGSFMMLL
jgi:hypothetical protein